MQQAFYNEQGLEACPKCNQRGKNLSVVSVDCADSKSEHRYHAIMRCKECRIQFEFWQDDIGVSLYAKPKEKKAPEVIREVPKVLPENQSKSRKSRTKRVQELARGMGEAAQKAMRKERKDA